MKYTSLRMVQNDTESNVFNNNNNDEKDNNNNSDNNISTATLIQTIKIIIINIKNYYNYGFRSVN